MTKPTHLDWVISDDAAKISEPSSGKKTLGWISGEKPPFQWFNWFFRAIDKWHKYLDLHGYDIVIGSSAYATHATLADALADGSVGANKRVLLLDSIDLDTTVALTKAGWKIFGAPGVVISDDGAGTGLSPDADGIEIWNIKFSGFSVAAIAFTANGVYGRVCNCRFTADNAAEFDDSLVPGGKKPLDFGNISEVA